MSRRTKLLLAFLAVVVGGYVVAALIGSSGGIPVGFSNARLQGALISQKIVDLSNQSVSDLEKINQFDKDGNYAEALILTSKVITQSQAIRDQAAALSSEIEKMTQSLSAIGPDEARQAVVESITNRLAMISRLINYSAYLSQLLDALRDRFQGGKNQQKVAALVEQINGEVRAINSFNAQALQAVGRFDKLTK